MFPHQWSRPGALFVTYHLPTRLARLAVQGLDIGRVVVVVDIDHLAPFDHRRRGRTVTEQCSARLDRMCPQRLAVQVVAIQAQVAKQYVQPLAVGRRCLGRVTALGMTSHLRLARMSLSLPDQLACLQAQAIHHPVVDRVGRYRSTTTQVQPRLGLLVVGVTVNRRYVHPIAPHDRTAPTQTWNLGLPGHVRLPVPHLRQPRIVGHHAVAIHSTEPRPVLLGTCQLSSGDKPHTGQQPSDRQPGDAKRRHAKTPLVKRSDQLEATSSATRRL